MLSVVKHYKTSSGKVKNDCDFLEALCKCNTIDEIETLVSTIDDKKHLFEDLELIDNMVCARRIVIRSRDRKRA